jgi:asparagine synthase (glutamine-hydrolysing)
MCGIAGIVAPEAKSFYDNLQRMVDAISHRGPDGAGAHFFDRCALGHRRLSIVDLVSGDQPMLARNGRVGLTFNGEIYGYQSVKATLSDYDFRTTSDTEVMLALYERHGSRMLSHLPGMFAFAIWDDERRELLCARDRFGEKPFYYAFGKGGEFVFASEIKAIIASGLVTPVLDQDALAHYLQFLYVHPHQTIYSNIYTLPPAHSLIYRDGRVSVDRYWHLPSVSDEMDLQEAAGRFRQLLDRAVDSQLVADVPVGAFLSGGLDSSTIVALASRHRTRLKTFSFGFGETINELPFAREVAELYQTDHTEFVDEQADIGEMLLLMQDFYDEPLADSSNIPTYLISKLARRHVKVVLTGDGADELLAGYSYWYRSLFEMERNPSKVSAPVQVLRMAARISHAIARPLRANGKQAREVGGELQSYTSIAQAHTAHKQFFTDQELIGLGLSASTKLPTGEERSRSNTLDDALRADTVDYMPGDILVKTDRASMANGLELRAPFLDVDFASFCLSLPSSLKMDSERDKLVLREALASSWPESVRVRGKQGFGAPVEKWLELDSVRALKQKYLADARQKLFEVIPFERARPFIDSGGYKTWTLLVLAIWMDRHEFATATDV